MTLALY